VLNSSSSSAEVKKEWSYTSTPPVCLQGLDRVSFIYCKHMSKGTKKTFKTFLHMPLHGINRMYSLNLTCLYCAT